MNRTVTVKPKSSKSKNRLCNIMDGNPVCVVEQDTGEELFLASANRKYFFWVSLRTGTNRFCNKTDAHWEVIELVSLRLFLLPIITLRHLLIKIIKVEDTLTTGTRALDFGALMPYNTLIHTKT